MTSPPPAVLFDFDGVLSANTCPGRPTGITSKAGNDLRFAEVLVRRLSDAIREVDGVGVISSSWRNQTSLATLYDALRDCGYAAPLIGVIPNVGCSVKIPDPAVRSLEILAWSAADAVATPGRAWAAVDDWNMFPWLGDRLIQTSSDEGFAAPHVTFLVERLGVP